MTMLVRKATANAGHISALDLRTIEVFGFGGPMGEAVTGVRNGDGNLQLIKWNVSGDGTSITRVRDAHAGAVSEVALAVVHYHVLSAVRNGSGRLEIISWTKDLAREGSATSAEASHVAICRFLYESNPDFFAVAYRDKSHDLRVEVWSLSSTGVPTKKGSASAGSVSEVAIAFVDSSPYRFVTAVKNGSGDLELIQWSASDDGTSVTRLGSASAGSAKHISLTALGESLFTSLCNGSGNLELIAWRAHADGSFKRIETEVAGPVHAVSSCLSFDDSGDDFMTTALRNGPGDLELIDWRLTGSGGLTRKSSASAGTTTFPRLDCAWNSRNAAVVNPAPHTILISAVCNAASDLELISWARE